MDSIYYLGHMLKLEVGCWKLEVIFFFVRVTIEHVAMEVGSWICQCHHCNLEVGSWIFVSVTIEHVSIWKLEAGSWICQCHH